MLPRVTQTTRSGKSIILEDFNIRTNDKSDIDIIHLLHFMESLNLTNLVEIAMHRLQNTIDLIEVPELSNIIMDV